MKSKNEYSLLFENNKRKDDKPISQSSSPSIKCYPIQQGQIIFLCPIIKNELDTHENFQLVFERRILQKVNKQSPHESWNPQSLFKENFAWKDNKKGSNIATRNVFRTSKRSLLQTSMRWILRGKNNKFLELYGLKFTCSSVLINFKLRI